MKLKHPLLLTALLFTSTLTWAENNNNLSNQIAALKKQADQLEQEANSLEKKLPQKKTVSKKVTATKTLPRPEALNTTQGSNNKPGTRPIIGRTDIGGVRVLQGLNVVMTPQINGQPAWDGSDLLVNMPSMNEDLRLLELKSALNKKYTELGLPIAENPLLEISGKVEGDGMLANSYGTSENDIDLSSAELDFNANVSKWALAFMSLAYDDAPVISGNRVGTVSNSRIYLRRGFLTIGDLDVTPVYYTMGQFYMPFGQYSSAILTTPLTLSIFRTNSRAMMLGLSTHNWYAQAYGFHGDTYTGNNSNNNRNDWGLNLGYNLPISRIKLGLGVGYISDISDSQGMLNNGNSNVTQFQGFNGIGSTNLQHIVSGGDLHANLGLGHLNLITEYLSGLRAFAPQDMSFDGKGARPSALHTEADLSYFWWQRPVTFAFAYDESWQALALNIPEFSYIIAGNISIWKDTIESLEYRHDYNYASTTSAGGGNRPDPIYGTTNRNQNMVTLQFGVYF